MLLIVDNKRSRRSAGLLHQFLEQLPDDLKPKLFSFRQVWDLRKAIKLAYDLSGPGDDVLAIAPKLVR